MTERKYKTNADQSFFVHVHFEKILYLHQYMKNKRKKNRNTQL